MGAKITEENQKSGTNPGDATANVAAKMESNWVDDFLTSFHAVNRYLRKGMLTEGNQSITRLQWTLLRHVHRQGDATMGDLAEVFGVRPSTVSQMADRLEREGLIRRAPSHDDARIKVVSLTEKGDSLFRELAAVMARRLEHGMETLEPKERQQLIALLGKLACSMAVADHF